MQEEMKFMQGTSGNQDYLIVATKGGLALGIKPVFEPQGVMTPKGFHGTGNWHIGARIRVASHDVLSLNVGVSAPIVFPGIPYHPDTIDAVRASCFVGTLGPPIAKGSDVDVLLEALLKGGFFDVLGNKLQQILAQIELQYSLETIMQFVEYTFRETLLKYEGLCVDNTLPSTPVVKGKVLAFPGKAGNA